MKKFLLTLFFAFFILFAERIYLKEGSAFGAQTEKSKEKNAEYRPFQTDEKGYQTVSDEAVREWKKTRRVALVAGSGDYRANTKLSPLHFTSDDSHRMATVLKNVGQFDEIVLLNDEEGKRDSNRSAKKENILREFKRLLKTEPRTFLFYFSGHGFQLDNENVVAPVNADLTKKGSERNTLNVSREIIDYAKYYKKLEREKNKSEEEILSAYELPPEEKDGVSQIMVFLDACRDSIAESKGTEGDLRAFTDFQLSGRLKNAKGVGVFLGTAPGEKSYEIKELNSGLFTHFLLEGISGGVQDRGVEYVTFNDLKLYVEEQMKAYSRKTGNKEQIPYSTGDYTGDFLVAVGRPAGKMKLDAVQYKFEGTEKTDAKRAYDEKGKILRLSFHNILSTGDVVPSSLEEISRISIKYNEKCFENNGIQHGSRKEEFSENCMTALQYDRQGNLDFQHGIRYIPDTGWEITRPYLDETATKNAVRDPKAEGGIQYQRIIFDFNGNPILNEYHGENRKDLKQERTVETLLADREGIAKIVQNFDVFSNRTLEEYYDADRKLKPNADGIARKVFAYDSKGNPILELYMDEFSEQKKIHSDLSRKVPKIYKTAYVYDYSVNEYGIIKSKRQYGKTEDIFAEGEDGLAKYEYEYSSDCLKFYSRTKEDAEKMNCIQSISYRGKDEKYKGNDRNIALSKFTYNENGLLTGEEYFRSSELPMVIKNGITKITYKYSEDCLNLLESKQRKLKCRETDADCLKKEKLVNTCVNEISTFNTSGHPESDFDGIATYKFRYDRGCLIYIADKDRCIAIETALDMKGNKVSVPKERTEEHFDENCLRMKRNTFSCKILSESYGSDGRLYEDRNGIARYARNYDQDGSEVLSESYGSDGKLKGLRDGIARTVIKYDLKGNKILEEYFGADGLLKENYAGIARYVGRFDEKGNQLLEEYYRADGQLAANQNGIARCIKKFDERGNLLLEESYKADGRLKTDSNGIARYAYKYDDKGFRVLTEFYGADGQLRTDSSGIARYAYKYNDKGKIILREYFGSNGKFKGDRNGIARYVYEYDANQNQVLSEQYGEDEKLETDSSGIARYAYKYDDKGRIILREYYGKDGRLKEIDFGKAYEVSEYDERGQKTSEEFYGADGKLKADSYGIARYVFKYDSKGNKISEEYYGIDQKLKASISGIAYKVWKYDNNANQILLEFYGTDGKLKADGNGIARYEYKYDEKGHKTKIESFGADGKLKGIDYEIAQYIYKYDERGNNILSETYGADGKLKADSFGIARQVKKYDERGLLILSESYGADEKLKADSFGIARQVKKYDERGLLILSESYGVDGKLKADRHGTARQVKKYDERGLLILSEYYGADGNLQENIVGARLVSKYNEKGYIVLEESYGTDGRLKKNSLRRVNEIDEICSSKNYAHQNKNFQCKSYEEYSDSDCRIKSVSRRIFDSEGNYVKDEDVSHLIGTRKWTAAEDRFTFSEKMKDITEKELVLEDGKQVEKEKKYSVITNASYGVQFPNPRGTDGKKTVTVELDRFYRPGKVRFE